MKKIFIGIMAIVLLVVLASGCVSSGSKNPKNDIYTSSGPLMEEMTPNADSTYDGKKWSSIEWEVTIEILSKSGAAYSNITANVTSYDANNHTIESKIYYLPYLPSHQSKKITFPSKKEVDHIKMAIIKATPST